jgi:Tfp pilus assembly protein PilX
MSLASSWPANPTLAQSDDITGLVDAFAPDPINDIPAAVADEARHFNKAERALSHGLTNTNAAQHSFPSPAQIREVVNNKPVAPAPSVRRVKSAQDDLEFLDGEVPEIEPQPKQSRRPVIQEQKPVAKQAKAPAPKDTGLSEKLSQSESRSRELERQLSEAKSQLAAAELEISRLSSIIESHSRARFNLPDNTTSPHKTRVEHASATAPRAAAVQALAAESVQVAGSSDLQVATITVEKADLRLGPGKNHSALMSLRRGSRLAVEARQGEWYRVFAPNGQRAWIHSSLVRFGDGAVRSNDGSAVTVKGFDAKLK